jgi:hypothetical protein
MATNLDAYKKDLDSLISLGEQLEMAIQSECYPTQFEAAIKKGGGKATELIAALPKFSTAYQGWYSEAKALIRQLLPDRLADFVRHYEKPKPRKELTSESYRIEDYLQGLTVTQGGWEKETVVGLDAAIPHVRQQLAILKAVKARFESSLFDIRQLVMADLFDSELDAAMELARQKFFRAAGAVAGVVLEKHLAQVCANHSVRIAKKVPGIGDLNDLLKAADVLDVPQWRFVQHLGDIRNLCDHNKATEPTAEQVADLVAGVAKIVKTVF